MANEAVPIRPSTRFRQGLAVHAVALTTLAEAARRSSGSGFNFSDFNVLPAGTRAALVLAIATTLTACPGGKASTNGSNVLAAGISRAEAQESDEKNPESKPDAKKPPEAEKDPEEWKYPPVIEWEVEVDFEGSKVTVTLSRTTDAKGTICELKSDDPTVPKGPFELKRPDEKAIKFPGVRSPENEERAKTIGMTAVLNCEPNEKGMAVFKNVFTEET